MKVSEVSVSEDAETAELSALVDGYRLWYRMPKAYLSSRRGNPFLVACLLPAMARGEDLEIDPQVSVCPRLLENLEIIQHVFVAWGPSLRVPFRRVNIKAQVKPSEASSQAVGSFFSGGVDGTFTFLRNREEITHLIFVKGIDMQLTNDDLFDEVWHVNAKFAAAVNKPILSVTSNVRFFGHANGCAWPTFFGAGLASIAYAIGLGKIFVASGMYYADLVPHGSHPLTDPLWSSDDLLVAHDGADTRRIEKLRAIAAYEPALRILRVCWQDKAYNCGECEKCLRTMIQLRALNIDAPTFPPLTDLKRVRRLNIWEDTELDFFRESLALASGGEDALLQSALRSCVRRNELRRLLRRTDDVLFSGSIAKFRKWLTSR